MLKIAREDSAEIKLFNVRRVGAATVIKPFEMIGPLLEDSEIAKALTASAEDGLFEGLILRGLIDE